MLAEKKECILAGLTPIDQRMLGARVGGVPNTVNATPVDAVPTTAVAERRPLIDNVFETPFAQQQKVCDTPGRQKGGPAASDLRRAHPQVVVGGVDREEDGGRRTGAENVEGQVVSSALRRQDQHQEQQKLKETA